MHAVTHAFATLVADEQVHSRQAYPTVQYESDWRYGNNSAAYPEYK